MPRPFLKSLGDRSLLCPKTAAWPPAPLFPDERGGPIASGLRSRAHRSRTATPPKAPPPRLRKFLILTTENTIKPKLAALLVAIVAIVLVRRFVFSRQVTGRVGEGPGPEVSADESEGAGFFRVVSSTRSAS